MDMKNFFERAIELREEYAKTSGHRLLILTQIVAHVFENGKLGQVITIEHDFNGRFYEILDTKDFQKVIEDLGINFRLVGYGEKPHCFKRTYVACLAKND